MKKIKTQQTEIKFRPHLTVGNKQKLSTIVLIHEYILSETSRRSSIWTLSADHAGYHDHHEPYNNEQSIWTPSNNLDSIEQTIWTKNPREDAGRTYVP